jgi:hypothetical protein
MISSISIYLINSLNLVPLHGSDVTNACWHSLASLYYFVVIPSNDARNALLVIIENTCKFIDILSIHKCIDNIPL